MILCLLVEMVLDCLCLHRLKAALEQVRTDDYAINDTSYFLAFKFMIREVLLSLHDERRRTSEYRILHVELVRKWVHAGMRHVACLFFGDHLSNTHK